MEDPEPLDATRLVGLLAEPDRRLVVAALILGEADADRIGKTTGLNRRRVTIAVERLRAAGLVERDDEGSFVLLEQAFERAARRRPESGSSEDGTAFADEPEDRRRVLERLLVDGRLTRMPSRKRQRLILLDHLSQRFEPGRHYTERQVNAALVSVSADTATLRRYLVDYGYLDRADGEYWRSGGTFPVD